MFSNKNGCQSFVYEIIIRYKLPSLSIPHQVDVKTLCTSNFECVNNAECTDGACYCRPGFEARGSLCVDVDECNDGKGGPCGPQARCTNTPGAFKCDCFDGYVGAPPRIKCKGETSASVFFSLYRGLRVVS